MPSPAPRFDTCGPTAQPSLHRWRFKLKSGLTWETRGSHQHARPAFLAACDEGLAARCLAEGHAYPTLNDLVEGEEGAQEIVEGLKTKGVA